MHNKRFYLSSKLITNYGEILGPDVIHISRVLRMKVGEILEVFDGLGKQYDAKIVYMSHNIVRVKIIKSYKNDKESPVKITLAQALLKKDKKMDIMIRQLTELGIHSWVTFNSSHSVPIISTKSLTSKIERWKRISLEAVKQCCRGILPNISFLENFEEILDLYDKNDLSLIFWEKKSSLFTTSCVNNDMKIKKILIVIGPEGGFDSQEIENAKNKGFIMSGLGPRILRSETASIVACSIIQYLFGDINKKLDITC